jgi:hypothetical protein
MVNDADIGVNFTKMCFTKIECRPSFRPFVRLAVYLFICRLFSATIAPRELSLSKAPLLDQGFLPEKYTFSQITFGKVLAD